MKRKLNFTNPQNSNLNDRSLHKELVERYSRQMLLPQININGQLALSNASVIIIGAGGIGSTVVAYLAGAGVGKLHIVDFDKVRYV